MENPGGIEEDVPVEILETVLDRIPERVPRGMSEDALEGIHVVPGGIPEVVLEKNLGKVPGKLPQRSWKEF